MNDRFKFRVWDKQGKEYTKDEAYLFSDGYLYVCGRSINDDPDRYIVEQCTGLKDANGKLIYEGDIIFINGEKWRVIWNDEDCAFFFSNSKEVYHQPIFPDFYMMTDDFEVIGNIHENAELMK